MEKITTKAELLEKIEWIKAIEIQARKDYITDMSYFSSNSALVVIFSIFKNVLD
jgi:hypothetical protein